MQSASRLHFIYISEATLHGVGSLWRIWRAFLHLSRAPDHGVRLPVLAISLAVAQAEAWSQFIVEQRDCVQADDKMQDVYNCLV